MDNLKWCRGRQICSGAFARKIREYLLQDQVTDHVHVRVYWNVRENKWTWQVIGKSTEPRLNSAFHFDDPKMAVKMAKFWWKQNGVNHLLKYKEN